MVSITSVTISVSSSEPQQPAGYDHTGCVAALYHIIGAQEPKGSINGNVQ